jgi:hypothetical protein
VIAAQIATGYRRRVLEDGDDKMNSSDEDDPDMKPDELTGVYTAGMDPKQGPVKLTPAEAAAQRTAAKASKAKKAQAPPPPPPPPHNSSDDDDLSRPEWIWSSTLGCQRRNKAWVRKLAESALALPAPEPERKPTPLTSPANSDDEGMSEDQRRQIEKAKRMSQKGKKNPVPEAKASKPTIGQEGPGSKDPHPMATRRQRASRAGGLRSGGGLGSTDTCVDLFNPSKT